MMNAKDRALRFHRRSDPHFMSPHRAPQRPHLAFKDRVGQGWAAIVVLVKDYEYPAQTSETMPDIAATRLMLNRLAPA